MAAGRRPARGGAGGADDAILAAYVEDAGVPEAGLRSALAAQTERGQVHPLLFGSALTGAGVDALTAAVAELLPARAADPDGPVSGSVFKIERGSAGEKVAYVRMFSGRVCTRDRVRYGRDLDGKVTAVTVFDGASADRRPCVAAGEIGKLWGLGEVRIGDAIGEPHGGVERQFAPPTLEAVVVPADPRDGARLRVALAQLAEQDPLIAVRDDGRGELSVALYGEVQKEVVEATRAGDYGIGVGFRETTTIHVERAAGTGEAVEPMHTESNPFLATIGLRVEPAPPGSGVEFRLEVGVHSVPVYAFKSVPGFAEHMAAYVRRTLAEGLHGWQVTDCIVSLIDCAYSSPDGPAATRGPLSAPADFRKLTPLVLMRALERAGTAVCEPFVRVGLDVPPAAIGKLVPALARLGGAVEAPSLGTGLARLEALLPAARVHELRRRLPALTGGEGVLETEFAGYRPVAGDPPVRMRTTPNPLNRDE